MAVVVVVVVVEEEEEEEEDAHTCRTPWKIAGEHRGGVMAYRQV